MDSPELTRYAVLLCAVIEQLLTAAGIDRKDPGLSSILKELDALTMRLAHRSRSAALYHETSRGQAALVLAEQLAEKLSAEEVPPTIVLEQRRWSQEQANGPMWPGIEPEDRVKTPIPSAGVVLLSDYPQD